MFDNYCNRGCGCCCDGCNGRGGQGPTGPTGPQGAQGQRGATGFKGPQGEKGQAGATILNSYETYNQFITEHPGGTAGDAYLVGGELYVWDGVNKVWKKMGSLVGPQGPQGEKGQAGATILNSYETYNQFITEHPSGTAGDAYLVGGELYVWDGVNKVWKKMGSLVGPQGEKGADGVSPVISVSGTVTGEPGTNASVVETFSATGADLLFTIPRGATGATGPKGERGPASAMIPFCVSKHGNTFYADEKGNPEILAFTGFSADSGIPTELEEGEWESGIIEINKSKEFGATFIMTYDGKLEKIYLRVSPGYTTLDVPAGITLRPFVCLAFADEKEMVFKIQKNTMTFTEPFVSGSYPSKECRKGALLNLNVEIKEGTLVAIVAGLMADGVTSTYGVSLAMGGGLYLS